MSLPTIVDLREVFLPRDRGIALVEVTEMLYARLAIVMDIYDHASVWYIQIALMEEIKFLRNLIDLIERS